ncbi:MAG: hypothetical protein AAFR14_12085, partial [Bacteroidota bacterium]
EDRDLHTTIIKTLILSSSFIYESQQATRRDAVIRSMDYGGIDHLVDTLWDVYRTTQEGSLAVSTTWCGGAPTDRREQMKEPVFFKGHDNNDAPCADCAPEDQ